ncbi:MAG TPA: bacterial transcriptional activator domain-containing protein, partial [bacterium]|nr:bacterial transcriptional activator domain-containing protein [bacterium]
MKARTVPIALVLTALAVWGALAYRPPLIGGGPVGRIYDIGAFGWWYARAAWSREGWARTPDPVLAARAAWHRPGMARELLGVPPGDLPALARRYFSLGLSAEAAELFTAAAARDPSFAASAAAYLAALEDWNRVLETAAALRGPAGAYWRGRALEETADPAIALEELSRVGEGPFRADAAARSGTLCERGGDRERSLAFYRRALELDPLDRCALEGLARIGDGPEAAAAARTLGFFSRSLPLRVAVGDRFLLLGADLPPGPMPAGARSRIALTLLGWSPGPEGSEV